MLLTDLPCSFQWTEQYTHSRTHTHIIIILLLFLQKQNLATTIYLFGLGTLLTRLGLKHMRIRSHHDLACVLVKSLLLGRPWWSTTSPTCLPLLVFSITSDQHQCRIPPYSTPMSHTPTILDHARVTVMTLTSPPSLPLSRPWAGVSAWQLVRSPLSA